MMTSTAIAATVGGLAVGLVGIAWPFVSWRAVASLEKPKYVVVNALSAHKKRSFYDREAAITIRQYAPYLVAEVTAEGKNMREAISDGFRQVANYIFGNNIAKGFEGASEKVAMTSPVSSEEDFRSMKGGSGEKIAMTSPVSTDMDGAKYVVSFTMPTKYKTTGDLPEPKNPNIRLRGVPGAKVAAISWRGGPRPQEHIVEAKKQELLLALKVAGIEVEDCSPKLMQYYPPFAPRFIRLQDLLLPVKE